MVGVYRSRPPPGWKPAGYVPPAQPKKLVTDPDVYRRSGAADAAVLAALGRAVPERHRRHRRARAGVADDQEMFPGVTRGGGGGFVG